MKAPIDAALKSAPVVPLIQSDNPETAVKIARALIAGGLPVLEIVLRTDAALACLAAIREAVPDAQAGAGTVLNASQVGEAAAHGATFIVSPGLDEGVVEAAGDLDLPVYPGIVTPGELQHAWNLGLRTVKFFPASIAGGVPALKALSSVFRDVGFMPTGGISESNLDDYLALPSVVACGGSWLTPQDAVASGDFERITSLAAAAVAISRTRRPA